MPQYFDKKKGVSSFVVYMADLVMVCNPHFVPKVLATCMWNWENVTLDFWALACGTCKDGWNYSYLQPFPQCTGVHTLRERGELFMLCLV